MFGVALLVILIKFWRKHVVRGSVVNVTVVNLEALLRTGSSQIIQRIFFFFYN